MKKSTLFFLLLLLVQPAFSKIARIEVTGLKKTKDDVVQKQLDVFIGQEASEENLHAAETILQSGGLYSKVEISFEPLPGLQDEDEEAVVMKVTLEEKISIIPIPFFYVSSRNISFGGFFLNMNLLGRQNMLMLGGLYSSDTKTGMFAFSKKNDELYRPGFSLFGSVSQGKITATDSSDRTALEYETFSAMGVVNTTVKLPDDYTAGFSAGWRSVFSDDIKDYHLFSAGINAGRSVKNWNGWFLSSKGFSLSVTETVTVDLDFNTIFSAGLKFQHPLTERLRLILEASGKWNTDAFVNEYNKRNSAGVNILPEDFMSPRLAGGKSGIEYALLKKNFGTFSLYADYQVGGAEDMDGSFCFAHGPNTGCILYLSKIAMPALSLGWCYNVPEKLSQFSFSFGMSF